MLLGYSFQIDSSENFKDPGYIKVFLKYADMYHSLLI